MIQEKPGKHGIIFVSGGSRSGKSGWAASAAESIPGSRLFVATAPVLDREMETRITNHQKDRQGRGWDTVEEEVDIARVLVENQGKYQSCVVDCLTLWVNNCMYRSGYPEVSFGEEQIQSRITYVLDKAEYFGAPVFFVSNEVGMGIVPDNAQARLFRDLSGRCNQIVAKRADRVVLLVSGIPMEIKNTQKS